METNKVILLISCLISHCYAQITIPLYLNSKLPNSRLHKTEDEFQNSIVYETMGLLKRSFRGRRLLRTMKRAKITHLRNVNNRSRKRYTRTALTKKDKKLHHHFPLFQGYGSHYVSAWVGTPPQRQTLLIDTGSFITAFPAKGCDTCGKDHTDTFFDPEASSTFEKVSCAGSGCPGMDAYCSEGECITSVSYLEDSDWSGYQGRDVFFLGNNEDKEVGNSIQDKFTFVCQREETGLFQTQLENGIMGLKKSEMHLPSVLRQTGKIPTDQFSLCLRDERFTSKEGYHAGLMTIGGVDPAYHTGPMKYARTDGTYSVHVRSIYLEEASPALDAKKERSLNDRRKVKIDADYSSSGKHTVDSGTTITYFSSSIADGFKKQWKSMTGFDFPPNSEEESISLTKEQVSKLPTILVQLEAAEEGCDDGPSTEAIARKLDRAHCNDVVLSFPPSHYLYKEKGEYFINMSFDELGIGEGILGANIMQGHDVLFDGENARLGFATASCKYKP